MKIDVFNQIGMDLSDEADATDAAKQIPECPDGLLELNLCRCIIDYKATSRLIDAAFDQVQKGPRPGKLSILYNIKFPEHIFLKWLFFGSRKLGLDKESASDEEIRENLKHFLGQNEILLNIVIIDSGTSAELHSFSYGK